MFGPNRGLAAVANIYHDIKKRRLRSKRQFNPESGRIQKMVAKQDAERYCKRLGLKNGAGPVPQHPDLVTHLRPIALTAITEFLKAVPESKKDDEALALIVDALPGHLKEAKVKAELLEKTLGKVIIERYPLETKTEPRR